MVPALTTSGAPPTPDERAADGPDASPGSDDTTGRGHRGTGDGRPALATDDISGADDIRLAARNGTSLGSSLLVTWVVGLVFTNVVLPRSLDDRGQLGVLGFGEAVASVVLVLANLGLDTYIRKEVARRSSTAREFLTGMLAVRTAASVTLTAAVVGLLGLLGREPAAIEMVLWFSLATFMMQTAGELRRATASGRPRPGPGTRQRADEAALGRRRGGRPAARLRGPFGPAALALSEAVKAVLLGVPAHRLLGIPLSFRRQRVAPVIKASLRSSPAR